MNPFKIFLIDDSEIHLAGLKFLLSENNNITIIGCAKSSKSALKSKELAQTDVVILDISLETESDGLDLVKPILSINPKIKIIILSQHKNIHFIVKSLQKGVSAYIAKDTSIEQLNIVIELIMKGDGFFLGETIPKNTLMDWFSETNPANNPQKPWNLS
ncbi:MAG TPA: response regulator transcription factor [Salinivirgaceae bacterium]|nr:response regulator transcription factor [Salinivirgaceae bacterium]HQA75728.1 response regulator transcription factor [Salinivirgaceae bacterium]